VTCFNLKDMKELLIIIPALNEEKTIKKIIQKAKIFGDVLVVNDGSKDNTKDIAIRNRALVISHNINLGYDKAINSGLEFFIKKKYKYVITIDADGQLPPNYIKLFKKKLKLNTDIVCGVRTRVDRTSEKIFLFFSKIIWNLQDPLCGIKGYSYNYIKKFFNKKIFFNSISTELLIKGKKRKINVTELKINNKIRSDESRFGSGILTELKIVFTFFKCLAFVR
jgi:glycosyltransferase involved in cell wall biosynthesis